jgi:acyl-CoA thioesterase-1
MSRKMLKVPVESVTDLKTCSTETIEGLEDADEPNGPREVIEPAKDSDMNALLKIVKLNVSHCSKAMVRAGKAAVKPATLLVTGALLLAASQASAQLMPPAAAAAAPKTLLVVGDSLSAEYGLRRGTGWVPLLDKQLASARKPVKVVNASISGDTTSGGRSRLAGLLKQHRPGVVVIELGGNDALRGLPLDMTEKNLTAMVQASKQAGAKVLLLGMQVPPNYGAAYGATFAGLFSKVAKAEKVALVPFFLKGIADADDSTAQFQADRIHPNEQAQARMLANVQPELMKLIP